MFGDLDDLMDDSVPVTKKTPTVAARNKSASIGRFSGADKKDDLDDLGDSFNFDDIGANKPAAGGARKGSMSVGGVHTGMSSA